MADQREPTGVGGWLLFLCLLMTIAFPSALIGLIARYNTVVDVLLFVALAGLSLVAGIGLWSKMNWAVSVAQVFFFARGIVAGVIAAEIKVGVTGVFLAAVLGILVGVPWIVYLGESKRVRNTFGRVATDKTLKTVSIQEGDEARTVGKATDQGLISDLERLSKMKADGLLTEEEFSTAKGRILQGDIAGVSPIHESATTSVRVWVCPKCGAMNEGSRTTCSDCAYMRSFG